MNMWVSNTLGADTRIQLFATATLMSAVQAFGQAKHPEPGTAVPGKETNGNQVPFRGRHNQLAGSPPFQSQIHVFSPTT
jgi:hypothetical protein